MKMKQLNLYIYKILPILLILFVGFILLSIGLYNFFFITFYIKSFLINIILYIFSYIILLLKILWKTFIFFITFYKTIIVLIKFLIGYSLKVIVIFSDLITHNYAFLWGDEMFKAFYENSNYGKIIIAFCDLITLLIVYALYFLYIVAIASFILYYIGCGYYVAIINIWWFIWHFPIVSLPFWAVYVFIWGYGKLLLFSVINMILNEPKFTFFLLYLCLPIAVRVIKYEIDEFLIYGMADARRYEWSDPDDEDYRGEMRDLTRIYRVDLIALVIYYICCKYILTLFLELGFKNIFLALYLFFFKIILHIFIIYIFFSILFLMKAPIIYYYNKLLFQIRYYMAPVIKFYIKWRVFNKREISILILYPMKNYFNRIKYGAYKV